MFAQGGVEFFRRRKTEAAREAAQCVRVFRDGVRLLFRFDLEPVLHAAEKAVGVFQHAGFLMREQLQVGQHRQHLQGAGFLEKGVPRAMQKLQRLHHELDLANPARAQFHVAPDIFVADDVALDPPFDAPDFLQDIPGRALGKNERLMLPEKFVGQLAAAGDAARFDQRQPFPGLAKPGVIIFHAVDRAGERSRRSLRAQPQIDPKKRARRIVGGEGLDYFRAELIEPLVIGQVRRNLSLFAVDEDHVDIGAVVQLPAPEFSQAENRKRRLRSTAPAPQLGIPISVNFAQADFGQPR